MPEYMLTLWKSGKCPYLLPARFWEEEGGLRVQFDAEGLLHVPSYAAACPDGIGEGFFLLLEALASACLAFSSLQQWLADPAYIALDARFLFFDREKGQSLLTFSDCPDGRPFLTRFADLCRGLGSGGALIGERLEEAGKSIRMEERRTAQFLLKWLRQARR
ncbi:MAG: hypothetical protein J6A42_04240 [Firmicutes bacterium]|nr:hypothetical protein [Bacillota bacterium]